MVLLITLLPVAFPCERQPLHVRTVQPAESQVDVPLDVRVAISFVGWGAADEARASLLLDGGEVAVERESWCYEHEGIGEVHCWWTLKPVEALLPERTYQVRIDSTESWQGEGSFRVDTRFTTGTGPAPELPGQPSIAVMDVWEEVGEAPCDYPLARRYGLQIGRAGGLTDPSALSLFHLEELDADGVSLGVVHSVYVSNPGDSGEEGGELKQYLDGSVPHADCFALVQESPSGQRSEPVSACASGGEDTGGTDTGEGDTGASDPGGPDGGAGDGGSEQHDPEDTGPGDAADAGALQEPGGCGGCAGGGAALLLPVLVGLRRRAHRR